MARKKIEHVVFDGMRRIRKTVDINQYNNLTYRKKWKKKVTLHGRNKCN